MEDVQTPTKVLVQSINMTESAITSWIGGKLLALPIRPPIGVENGFPPRALPKNDDILIEFRRFVVYCV